ncbi:MAG: N-acetyltransferase [Gemmatimonadetes bacterium]|nr:N-acetyltransferase [Gemmatimonadota bacterium]
MIRSATVADADAIARIYNHYVTDTIVTFEETPLPADEMARRIGLTLGGSWPWFVLEDDGRVQGYAYASPWKSRIGYRFTLESTVYLDPASTGRGFGSELYTALFADIATREVHAVVGGIALPNEASVRLHERFGMTKVAHFPEVGLKFGRWIDVGYWQRTMTWTTTDGAILA